MFKCKNKDCPKAFENLFTLKPKSKYQLKRSRSLLEPFCKIKFSQLSITYRGPRLWNTIVLSQNTDLEQSTTLKVFKEKKLILKGLRLIFSLLTMLHFYFDIESNKKMKMYRKELIIKL